MSANRIRIITDELLNQWRFSARFYVFASHGDIGWKSHCQAEALQLLSVTGDHWELLFVDWRLIVLCRYCSVLLVVCMFFDSLCQRPSELNDLHGSNLLHHARLNCHLKNSVSSYSWLVYYGAIPVRNGLNRLNTFIGEPQLTNG